MRAPALVADPSRDADCEVELQVAGQLILRTREAMRDPTDERAPVLPKDGDKVLVCVALVEEDRLPNARRQLQLPKKGCPLCWLRREIPEVVQAAFANR